MSLADRTLSDSRPESSRRIRAAAGIAVVALLLWGLGGLLAPQIYGLAPSAVDGGVRELPSLSDFGALALVMGLVASGFFVIRRLEARSDR